jgi:hypothetical protein
MNRPTLIVGVVGALLCFCATSVLAQVQTVVVDENGNGTAIGSPVTGTIAVEPVSGLSTLRYHLPFGVFGGDVLGV